MTDLKCELEKLQARVSKLEKDRDFLKIMLSNYIEMEDSNVENNPTSDSTPPKDIKEYIERIENAYNTSISIDLDLIKDETLEKQVVIVVDYLTSDSENYNEKNLYSLYRSPYQDQTSPDKCPFCEEVYPKYRELEKHLEKHITIPLSELRYSNILI